MNGPQSVTATFQQARPPGTFQPGRLGDAGGGTRNELATRGHRVSAGELQQTFNSGTTGHTDAECGGGFLFSQWSGTGCTGGVVQMTQNRSCTATFVADRADHARPDRNRGGLGDRHVQPGRHQLRTGLHGGVHARGDRHPDDDAGRRLHVRRVVRRVRRDGPVEHQDRSCTATFNPPRTLTVAVVGSGTVTSIPIGISCGQDCSEAFTAGTNVTLVTSAAAGFTFGGWSGAGCGATVQMTQESELHGDVHAKNTAHADRHRGGLGNRDVHAAPVSPAGGAGGTAPRRCRRGNGGHAGGDAGGRPAGCRPGRVRARGPRTASCSSTSRCPSRRRWWPGGGRANYGDRNQYLQRPGRRRHHRPYPRHRVQ